MYYVLVLISLLSTIAQSASAAPVDITFDSLMQSGYEIKAVNLIPLSQAADIFGAANAPKTASQTLVTLQKGSSVAVCIFDTGWWSAMLDSMGSDATACIKR
jgi:hypothetical protein